MSTFAYTLHSPRWTGSTLPQKFVYAFLYLGGKMGAGERGENVADFLIPTLLVFYYVCLQYYKETSFL